MHAVIVFAMFVSSCVHVLCVCAVLVLCGVREEARVSHAGALVPIAAAVGAKPCIVRSSMWSMLRMLSMLMKVAVGRPASPRTRSRQTPRASRRPAG